MVHSDSHKTIQDFFSETSRISNEIPIEEYPVEPSSILSILRPYQLETVKWMIMRELHTAPLLLGEKIINLPLGGILADEMGLGKTVEVLACILGHRKNKENTVVQPEIPNSSSAINSTLEDSTTTTFNDTSPDSPNSDPSIQDSVNESNEMEKSLTDTTIPYSMETSNPDEVTNLSDQTLVNSSQIPTSACFLESSRQNLKKRPCSDYSDSPILCKRPAFSSIQVNRTLKKKIKELLKDYFDKFKRFYKKKHIQEKHSFDLMDISFKIIILNRFYEFVTHKYSKQQTWGFLLTEFNVDDPESIGYKILEKEMRKKNKKNENPSEGISDEDSILITTLIDEFLTRKKMAQFEKDFNNVLAYSLYIAPGDHTVLQDCSDVRCKCGSDKAQGKKITCQKCKTSQHYKCVGLDITFNDFNNYICPYCWMKKDSVETAATLIIIPSTLTQQWKIEIKKYAINCNLKVCIYKGASKDYVLPYILASFDVVIVSFETLRSELNYASAVVEKNTRTLRHNKRYLPFASPLTSISWWRLCIDEAQMVECPNKVSEMVSHLKCTYRWAVTGTPIGKSLKDLHGLITFLEISPFSESYTNFKKLLQEQTLLHYLFAHVMRRKTKNEVSQELNLPDLKVEKTWLSFTPVEGYFYQYTHSLVEETFMQKMRNVKNLNQRLSETCRKTADSVLLPLVALRQACVHPQAVNKKHAINLSKTVSMEELLEQMIKKAKTECEDILRLYIMNKNGAAGTKIFMGQFAAAIDIYREVLAKIKQFEHLIVDDFQILHAKHNLYETYLKDKSIVLTPEEQQFPQQISNLEQKYIERRQDSVVILLQNVEKHSTEIENYLKDFRLSSFEWWQRMINCLKFEELTSRIYSELEKNNITLQNIKLLLTSINRLSNTLQYWLTEVEDKRSLTYVFLDQITKTTPVSSLCTSATECHLRHPNSKRTCLLCKMENLMTKYENILFNGKVKENQRVNDENETNPLNWKVSAYECILSAILSCARSVFVNNDITQATNQLKVLGLLKREFKTVRATWTKQCDLVHGYDEVEMAKSRFDAVSSSIDKLKNTNPLFQSRFDIHEAESVISFSRLLAKNGSYHYLLNLRNRYSNSEFANECCPVCHCAADERRGVMSCGHFTCYLCMMALIKHSNLKKILCPVCRTSVLTNNITYVHGGGGSTTSDITDVRGNYSVKILSITSKVLRLKKQDPKVKILIFSTWDRVMDVIAQAFKENDIKFQRFRNSENQRISVTLFKEKDDVTALLIPIRSGSKGLNLTEASHIIFTEPVLSIADEKQAIGRIYRLGQSKDMVVHKFMIKNTIEKHLCEMNQQLQEVDGEGSELTFKHLKDLFIATTNDIENES